MIEVSVEKCIAETARFSWTEWPLFRAKERCELGVTLASEIASVDRICGAYNRNLNRLILHQNTKQTFLSLIRKLKKNSALILNRQFRKFLTAFFFFFFESNRPTGHLSLVEVTGEAQQRRRASPAREEKLSHLELGLRGEALVPAQPARHLPAERLRHVEEARPRLHRQQRAEQPVQFTAANHEKANSNQVGIRGQGEGSTFLDSRMKGRVKVETKPNLSTWGRESN